MHLSARAAAHYRKGHTLEPASAALLVCSTSSIRIELVEDSARKGCLRISAASGRASGSFTRHAATTRAQRPGAITAASARAPFTLQEVVELVAPISLLLQSGHLLSASNQEERTHGVHVSVGRPHLSCGVAMSAQRGHAQAVSARTHLDGGDAHRPHVGLGVVGVAVGLDHDDLGRNPVGRADEGVALRERRLQNGRHSEIRCTHAQAQLIARSALQQDGCCTSACRRPLTEQYTTVASEQHLHSTHTRPKWRMSAPAQARSSKPTAARPTLPPLISR